MRPIIEKGYLYLATPPLYKCSKGSHEEYCWDEQQREQFIMRYGNGEERQVKVQRYKGLGEMNAEQLWDTTMNPKTRTLVQVQVDDESEGQAEKRISVLMSDDVAPRREWIDSHVSFTLEDNYVVSNKGSDE